MKSRDWKFSVKSFLCAIVLMIVSFPFMDGLRYGIIIESTLFTLVMLSAVFDISNRRGKFVWAIVLSTPGVVGKWVNYWYPDLVSPTLYYAACLLFLLFVIWDLLQFIFQSPQVDSEVMSAGVAVYLILGLLWALAYSLTNQLQPNSFIVNSGQTSFDGFASLYFSFITLATMGYGDIVPVSVPARMLSMVEGITGIFYTTMLLARLVAIYRPSVK
jgi:hypothetical protein